ncbi:MAG TPA: SPOR domain-containing protein [Flavobacteriales bacterium]|nr:SPOR domain-containing protein [Flavobacteriales bacterium]
MDFKFTRNLLPGMFLDYDCVIIPGLGGFVCNGRSAWYDDENEEMVPPSRDVIFNPNLIHNDGLLAQEIMRARDLSYSEAMKHVEEEASFMVRQLKEGKPVEIARVGRLYSGDDGVTRFLPDSELVRVLRSFGHARIPLAKLVEKKEKKVIPIYTPLMVKIARVAAVIALPIVLGGAWILSDSSNSSTLLSVLPTFDTEAIVSTFMPSEGSTLFNPSDEEIAEEIEIEYATEEVELLLSENKVEEEETLAIQINFLIIGGAFSIEENALNLAETLKLEGFNPTHHYQNHNNLNLVALGEFETESSAREALKKARKKGRTASWLKRL